MVLKGLLTDIELKYSELSEIEKKIACYVKENTSVVPFMSITQLAEECQVCPSTVNHFCKHIGAGGYKEFKIRLTLDKDLNKKKNNSHPDGQCPDDCFIQDRMVFRQVLENHQNAILRTHELLDISEINKTVQMMINADTIYFSGFGNSATAAKMAETHFIRVSPKVCIFSDKYIEKMALALSDSSDLLIVFSDGDVSTDDLSIVETAKKYSVKVSAVTSFRSSSLAEFADSVLICAIEECEKNSPLENNSMVSMFSQLYITDVLYHYYCSQAKTETGYNRLRTAEAVAEKLL